MPNRVFVVGHKNPDTDSVCSAIAYASLKNKTQPEEYIPRRAGEISKETQFVLDRFGQPVPELITDVSTQVKDIDIRKTEGAKGTDPLKKAWSQMRDEDIATLPITDQNYLVGVISVKDIATANMDIYDRHILSRSETTFRSMVETLEGTLLLGDLDTLAPGGKISIAAADPELMAFHIGKEDIIILGNREESQQRAIEEHAGCLVICLGAPVSDHILNLAKERNCSIISTPHDTYTASRLISQSIPIRHLMCSQNLITFQLDDRTEEVRQVMAKVRHRDFPVLDELGNYAGMISRRSLLDAKKKKVILVDHNEKSQAVDGIEDANLLEIIDHHKLGTLETISPVFFRNQPVGCTCSIVYQMYQEAGVVIDRSVAGLMCSAIISDTLLFRSPTCTPYDKYAAEDLARIAGIDLEKHAEDLFRAGSDYLDRDPKEILNQDFKRFHVGDLTYGVAQNTFLTEGELLVVKDQLLAYIKAGNTNGVDLLFVMLTNILEESSLLLCYGKGAKEAAEDAFHGKVVNDGILLPGVVSRKKQLIPVLIGHLPQ